jgi:hypothetical protein
MPERLKPNYIDHISIAVQDLRMDGTGEVTKFIDKHGEGIMVFSLNVDNTIESLELLKRNGARLIDQKPRFARELNRYFAFLHPKQCHGVLAEVIEGNYRKKMKE